MLMIIRSFHWSGLDIQYIKPSISCVESYLTLQFIVSYHSVDDFSTFKSRERAREQGTEPFHRKTEVTRF